MTHSWVCVHSKEYAIVDDVTAVAPYICLHRLHFKAALAGHASDPHETRHLWV